MYRSGTPDSSSSPIRKYTPGFLSSSLGHEELELRSWRSDSFSRPVGYFSRANALRVAEGKEKFDGGRLIHAESLSWNGDLAVHQQGEEPVAELGELLVFYSVDSHLLVLCLNRILESAQDFFVGTDYWAVIYVVIS
jgi:hypothetical protein